MRVPVIIHKPGACFPIVDNHIKVYGYEMDHEGKVTRAKLLTIHVKAPLSKLRDMYAAQLNIFPHEIDMFYENNEIFDDDTCDGVGIEHEKLVRMQIVPQSIHTKLRNEDTDTD